MTRERDMGRSGSTTWKPCRRLRLNLSEQDELLDAQTEVHLRLPERAGLAEAASS